MQNWKVQLKISGVLLKWMAENNLSLKDVSVITGISENKINLLIKQRGYPNLNELIALSNKIGVSTDYLLCIMNE